MRLVRQNGAAALKRAGFSPSEASKISKVFSGPGQYFGDERKGVLRDIAYDRGFWMRGGKMPERVAKVLVERSKRKYGKVIGETASWIRSGGLDPSKYT